jgi:hypothetical protein
MRYSRLVLYIVLLTVLITGLPPHAHAGEPKPIRTLSLEGDTFHVQGIDLDDTRVWVTSVDKDGKRGLLAEYRLPTGQLLRLVEIQHGSRYHPGGFTADADSLWIPVAEYKRDSSAIVQQRNKQTLQVTSQFEAPDHIGAIAATQDAIAGANWDARNFYVWDKKGQLLRKVANPSPIAIQDMEFVNGHWSALAWTPINRESLSGWNGPRSKLSGLSRWAAPNAASPTHTKVWRSGTANSGSCPKTPRAGSSLSIYRNYFNFTGSAGRFGQTTGLVLNFFITSATARSNCASLPWITDLGSFSTSMSGSTP